MFATSNSSTAKVLDTFKVDSNGIYLKPFHIHRTQQAFALCGKGQESNLKKIQKIYDWIEQSYAMDLQQRMRIVFNNADLSYQINVQALEPIQQPVLLEVIHTIRQHSGRGLQNFKWEGRDYWEKIIHLKSTQAADVISLNELGNCVETSRYNLFFYEPASDLVYVPSLDSGCIAGVFRAWAISQRQIELPGLGLKSICESEVHVSKLNRFQLFVANSVRGVLSAGLAI